MGSGQVADDDRGAAGRRPRASRADVRRARAVRGDFVHARRLVADGDPGAALPGRQCRAERRAPCAPLRGRADVSNGIPPVPLFGPVTLNTSEALREAKGGLVKSAPYLAAGIAIANADEIVEIVQDLLADTLRTLTVTSQQELCNALRAWGRDLEHLAEVILSPVADAGADLVQMLAIEVLRIKFARLASMMSLAGAIVDNPHVGAHFDFEKLRDF